MKLVHQHPTFRDTSETTHSGVQSAFELPAPMQALIASLTQRIPDGAEVVAA